MNTISEYAFISIRQLLRQKMLRREKRRLSNAKQKR